LTWASTASDRTKWRRLCHSLLDQFESQRIANLEHRREKTQQVHKSRLSGPSAASTVGARVHPRSGCLLIGGAAIPHPPLSCQPRAATSPDVTSTASSTTVLTCSNCGRTCSSRIGMFAHQRVEIHRKRRLSPWCVCVCVPFCLSFLVFWRINTFIIDCELLCNNQFFNTENPKLKKFAIHSIWA